MPTMRRCVCLGCGSCCALIGLALVCVMLGWLNRQKDGIYGVVHDMVYIDNSRDTDTTWGFEATSEKKQFESFMRSTADSYTKCKNDLKDDQTAEDTCYKGQLRVAAVFNVTNAEEVMAGGKAKVQEIGPFYARKRSRQQMTDADRAKLDATGVASVLEESIYTMEQCDAACEAMLEQEIIIPNPIWAYATKANIVEAFLALSYLSQVAGQAGKAAAQAEQTQTPSAAQVGQQMAMILGAQIQALPQEVQAISADVLALAQAGQTFTALERLGGFMLGASRAKATGSGNCRFGSSAVLDTARCVALLDGFSGTFASTWTALMTMSAAAYRTGLAAPVFIKAKIKEVLSYKTNTREPLLEFNISFPCFEDTLITASTLPSSYQVGSKFGEEGTEVMVRLANVTKNCKYDPDCTLSDITRKDSCEDSSTCRPLHYKHYGTSQIPPRIWGKDKGFSGWGPGKTFPMFLAGIPLQMKIVKEASEKVDGKDLDYLEIRVNKMIRRVENCNRLDAQDSPGIDCGGPRGAVGMGPYLARDVPTYASPPFFDSAAIEDYAGANAGDTNGYDPLTKVEMTKCTGHSWCDSGRPEAYRSELRAEPETGILYSGTLAGQINVRLYRSRFQPMVPDAAVPVFWIQIVGEAPINSKKTLADLQNMPDFLGMLVIALTIAGAVLFCCGLVCCGVGCKAAKQQTGPKNQQMQEEPQPVDLQQEPTPSSIEQGQAQTTESKEQQQEFNAKMKSVDEEEELCL